MKLKGYLYPNPQSSDSNISVELSGNEEVIKHVIEIIRNSTLMELKIKEVAGIEVE